MQTSLEIVSNDLTDHSFFALSKNLLVGLVLSSRTIASLGALHSAILRLMLEAVMPRMTDALFMLPPLAFTTDIMRIFCWSESGGSVMGAGRNGASPIMARSASLDSLDFPEQALLNMSRYVVSDTRLVHGIPHKAG